MLSYNRSKLTQLIYSPNDAYPTPIHPKMILNLAGYQRYTSDDFEAFDITKIKDTDTITIHRDYALGDLIQLIPVARLIKKRLNIKRVNIVTSGRFLSDLRYMYSDLCFLSTEYLNITSGSLDLGFIFSVNGLLEKDHSCTNSENQKHRVGIYLNFFGINEYKIEELDWSEKRKGDIIVPNITHDKKVIGLQLRGSGKMKTLPIEMIKQMATELAVEHYVVLIDHDPNMGFEGTNILNLCGKLKTPQVIAMLSDLDLCITMDSGVLWMAHTANCPTLTFLASTRAEERISLHPQYPEKVKAIDLTKYIKCEPCFETMTNCKGKIRCMKEVNYDMIKTELFEKVKLILGV